MEWDLRQSPNPRRSAAAGAFGPTRSRAGTMRPVFEDPTGRQFVMDGEERVYGVWLLTEDIDLVPFLVRPDEAVTAPIRRS